MTVYERTSCLVLTLLLAAGCGLEQGPSPSLTSDDPAGWLRADDGTPCRVEDNMTLLQGSDSHAPKAIQISARYRLLVPYSDDDDHQPPALRAFIREMLVDSLTPLLTGDKEPIEPKILSQSDVADKTDALAEGEDPIENIEVLYNEDDGASGEQVALIRGPVLPSEADTRAAREIFLLIEVGPLKEICPYRYLCDGISINGLIHPPRDQTEGNFEFVSALQRRWLEAVRSHMKAAERGIERSRHLLRECPARVCGLSSPR